MGSMITLFSEPPRSNSFPSTFVVSFLLHASLLSLLTVKVMNTHRIIERFPTNRYALRVLDFHSTEPQTRQAAGGGSIVFRGSQSAPQPVAHKLASGGRASGSPTVTRQTAQLMPAPQTLVQPDIPHDAVLPEKMPVPLVVLWAPDKAAAKKIVPALPDKAAIAVVHPSLDLPIKEENLADLKISSTVFVTQSPAPTPSTTSPVVVHGPEEAKKVPQTTSKQPEQPTPARVLSLSDIRVAEGRVTVPLANETSSKLSPGTMVPGQLKDPSPAGNGTSTSKNNRAAEGVGSGDRAGNQTDSSAITGSGVAHPGSGDQTGKDGKTGAAPGQGSSDRGEQSTIPGHGIAQSGSANGLAQGSAAGSGSGNQPSSVHISLPKDGQFGVVVVGSSIEERYPETAELWSGRMASTVYLRVGLPKSWILQYALPRLADAAVVGSGGRLEAPWPFEIVRPNLDPGDVDADALILHGYVNKDGRFEKLAVVFPTQFIQSGMVLNVLNQWQFRPAKQNGLLTPVEVLLIIPDQSE